MRKGAVRNSKKKDQITFLIPAFLVYSTGMLFCAWELVRRQQDINIFSMNSIVGISMVIIGLTINLVAAFTLRRSYSSTLEIREDHRLVTHGIFRFIRHPIYLGSIIVSFGVPVFVWTLYGFLILAGLVPLVLHRIKLEEKMLIEEYGDTYRKYMESTGKLLPFVY